MSGPATSSAPPPARLRAAVFGAGGGLGSAVVELLAESPRVARVHAFSRASPVPRLPKVDAAHFDLDDEASIAAAAARCRAEGPLHLVLVATGVLHAGTVIQPEKSWRTLDPEAMARSFAVNAIGPALIARHFLDLLARDERAVFAALSARVGSIGDNRLGGWYSYRASKAALHMLIRTFAIELARRNPGALCVALHPGSVDTALSRPFQAAVPAGRLFTPRHAAERLLAVVDALGPADSGGVFAWDGSRIPF
jgi:NAD(P)-dependent dehydrogenase (short-subunit alcohol dehydrogenase family)